MHQEKRVAEKGIWFTMQGKNASLQTSFTLIAYERSTHIQSWKIAYHLKNYLFKNISFFRTIFGFYELAVLVSVVVSDEVEVLSLVDAAGAAAAVVADLIGTQMSAVPKSIRIMPTLTPSACSLSPEWSGLKEYGSQYVPLSKLWFDWEPRVRGCFFADRNKKHPLHYQSFINSNLNNPGWGLNSPGKSKYHIYSRFINLKLWPGRWAIFCQRTNGWGTN